MLRFRLIMTTCIMFWYSVEVTLLASWFTPVPSRLRPQMYSVILCNNNIIHNKQILYVSPCCIEFLKDQTLIQHNPCKQKQADNIFDDHNAIHVQQLMIRASCVYHLHGFLSALNIQGVRVCICKFVQLKVQKLAITTSSQW